MTGTRLIFAVSIVLIVLIGFIDQYTGSHISMMLLYALPILLSAWYCGKTEGVIVAIAAAASWLIVNLIHPQPGESLVILSWNALTRVGIFVLIAYTVSLQAALKQALERERLRANTDQLTGMLNTGAFRERVEEEMIRASRYKHSFSLAFIDLDNFKHINDTQGHERGNKLLRSVCETIITTIRKTDIAGRIGGDEFAICYPETSDEQVRQAVANLAVALDIMTSQSGWQVTASIGVVTSLPDACLTYDALLGRADRLMYVAKGRGKNAAEFETVTASA
jgi:diguanylate cyclase (GGDEF)-like protein